MQTADQSPSPVEVSLPTVASPGWKAHSWFHTVAFAILFALLAIVADSIGDPGQDEGHVARIASAAR